MAEEKRLSVKVSLNFAEDLEDVFNYGVETFGVRQAENYENEIWDLIERLPNSYRLFQNVDTCPRNQRSTVGLFWILI